jgi:hypothetical protein
LMTKEIRVSYSRIWEVWNKKKLFLEKLSNGLSLTKTSTFWYFEFKLTCKPLVYEI